MVLLRRPLATPLLGDAAVLVLRNPVSGLVPVFVTGKLICPSCLQPTSDIDQGLIVGHTTLQGSFLPLEEDDPHPQAARPAGPDIHAATPKAVCPSCQQVVRFPLELTKELADQGFQVFDPDGHQAYHEDARAYLEGLRATAQAAPAGPITPISDNYCLVDPSGGDPDYLGD